jgi:hypothetical protein
MLQEIMLKASYQKIFQTKANVFNNYFLLKTDSRSQLNLIYTIITAAAAAQVNYLFFGIDIVLLVIFSVLSHEFAHYVYSKSSGAKTFFPLFIPLPFFIIGMVRSQNLSDEYRSSVAISGMIAGSFTLFIMLLLNIYFNYFNPSTIIFMILFEILINYFGSDGKKYRLFKKG